MFKRIVVALDGSELAEQVLPQAADLARRYDATLVLCKVVPPVALSVESDGAYTAGRAEMQELEQERAETYLRWTTQSLAAQGLRVEWATRIGPPPETIVQFVGEQAADLVAIATHGRSGLGRVLLGSVADYLVRNANVPILLVRAKGKSDAQVVGGAPARERTKG